MSQISKIIVVSLLLAAYPASALQMHEMHPRGQVPSITTAEIDGHRVGLALAIDRGVNELPNSTLIIFPSEDSADWRYIELPNGPGAMATGDVTGDGNDEVAITTHFQGESCPSELLGQMSCGVVRILDGRSLTQGEAKEVGLVRITPPAGTCSPSSHPPSSLSLEDVTGDGLADLALGQLGSTEGSCGVVHVISGDLLQGDTRIDAACARVEGRVVESGEAPHQFGVTTQLYRADGRGMLAVGAPHASSETHNVSGYVAAYDLTEACPGDGVAPSQPPLVAETYGLDTAHQLGAGMAHVEDLLWVSGKGGVLALDPISLDQIHGYPTALPLPLSDAGDFTGDGRSELLIGPWIMTVDGGVVMALNHFAEQNFRGAAISSDHIISSDNFGSRLWSLTDLRTPHVSIAADRDQAVVGETVRVSITDVIAVMPVDGAPSWSVSGGTAINSSAEWIDVRTDRPGTMVARLALGGSTATVRVPVVSGEESANVTGPSTVQAGKPFILRVSAPGDASVSWQAPGASPSEGNARTIEVQYDSAGRYTTTIDVAFSTGQVKSLTHDVLVVKDGVGIDAPDRIPQGQDLGLEVPNPRSGLTYVWYLEGARMGPLGAAGESVSIPTAGWGPVQVSVVARNADGEAVAVGQKVVDVENLPPKILSLATSNAYDVEGVEADLVVSDPGGDPVTIAWYVDGRAVGEGNHLAAPDLEPGQINLTAVVLDEGGLETTITQAIQIAESGWVTIERTEEALDASGNIADAPQDGDRLLPAPVGALMIGLMAALATAARRRMD